MQPTPWPVFLAGDSDTPAFDWKLGEHVAILGKTDSGKTHLSLELLKRRGYVVVIATKPKDALLAPLRKEGYKVAKNMRDIARLRRERHILLWPEPKHLRSDGEQTSVLRGAFEYFYHTGNRAIFADETYYLVHHLGLEEEVTSILYRGRSLGLSIICAGQRPFHLPLAVYSQSRHLFFFREHDKRNRDRLAEIGGIDVKEVAELIAGLPQHHFLYIDAQSGRLAISKVQRVVTRTTQPATEVPV